MKKRIFVTLIVALMVVSGVQAQGKNMGIAAIAKKAAPAFAYLKYTHTVMDKPRELGAAAVCIQQDSKGRSVFLTVSLSSRLRRKDLSNFRIIQSGIKGKEFKAELMGVENSLGFGFVRTVDKVDWPKIKFQPNVKLTYGQPVVSVNITSITAGAQPVVGVARIATNASIPEKLYRVTGGTLGSSCSVVFNMKGQAIGLVARQIQSSHTMQSPGRQATRVYLQSNEASNYFYPVSTFAHAILKMPNPESPTRRAWAGVNGFQAVTDSTIATYGIDKAAVEVGRVFPKGPAAAAGLKEGDLVIGIDGKDLKRLGSAKLTAMWFGLQLEIAGAGATVNLNIRREDKNMTVPLKLGKIPTQAYEADKYVAPRLGVVVRDKVAMDRITATGPEADVDGVIAAYVAPRSSAAVVGIRSGDLITTVNNKSVKSVARVREVVEAALKDSPEGSVVLLVRRNGEIIPMSVTPAPAPIR